MVTKYINKPSDLDYTLGSEKNAMALIKKAKEKRDAERRRAEAERRKEEELQRKIERAAFVAGGRDYSAPMQTVGDFISGTRGSMPSKVMPTYMGGKCNVADMNDVLPDFVTRHLRYGIQSFDRRFCGFADESAILTGAETRTSAPVRILRTEDMSAIGHSAIYPCGEGAGYAGGITSAAVDGIKTALAVIKKYKKI